MALMVDAEWRDLVVKGDGIGYVEVDVKRREADYVNGKWRIKPTAEAKE